MQFDHASGYRRLDSWALASIAQLATYDFCEKFLSRQLDPTGRQYDQMTQAARSGKVNIVEGSARSDTSKETEMKLTSVARASLSELHSDYEDWLLRHKLAPWPKNSAQSQAIYNTRLDKPDYGEDQTHDSCLHILAQKEKFSRWLESDDHATVANALLIIISRAIHTLVRQIEAQGETFTQTGGFREKLTTARLETRAGQEAPPVEPDAPACPECGKPMRRRKAKTGPNAGKEFWGCTGYPACKTTRPIA